MSDISPLPRRSTQPLGDALVSLFFKPQHPEIAKSVEKTLAALGLPAAFVATGDLVVESQHRALDA